MAKFSLSASIGRALDEHLGEPPSVSGELSQVGLLVHLPRIHGHVLPSRGG